MRKRTWSYRFAEQVLNSKLDLKKEVEDLVESIDLPGAALSRPNLNKEFEKRFLARGWAAQPLVMEEEIEAKLDFQKDRIGVEVAFSHSSFIGIDLLKFQTMSYSGLDRIDVGIYVVVTSRFLNKLVREHKQKWSGSLTFEKVTKYLPLFRSAIQVPIFVIGLEG
ncbi:MAG: hypothetical protein LYZ66_06480 [Nitrososphaerales archaeon]|nr:hypothetical protein [Nitrososphaerales archaeon]